MIEETPYKIFLPARCYSANCPNKKPMEVSLTKGFCSFCGLYDSAYVLTDNIDNEIERLDYHLGCLKVAVRGDA